MMLDKKIYIFVKLNLCVWNIKCLKGSSWVSAINVQQKQTFIDGLLSKAKIKQQGRNAETVTLNYSNMSCKY